VEQLAASKNIRQSLPGKAACETKKVPDSRASCWFALAVQDTGIGIPQVM
jgi:hypothetical protein